jgi:hypothetical protein
MKITREAARVLFIRDEHLAHLPLLAIARETFVLQVLAKNEVDGEEARERCE